MSVLLKQDVVLLDLDGTLININPIQHLIGEWDEFHKATFGCPANAPMIAFARLLQNQKLTVIVISGKPVTYQAQAIDWLRVHGITPDFILMRPALNSMSDAELKPHLIRGHLGAIWKDRVLFAVEDRDKMVDAWRAEGIMCLQCAESLY